MSRTCMSCTRFLFVISLLVVTAINIDNQLIASPVMISTENAFDPSTSLVACLHHHLDTTNVLAPEDGPLYDQGKQCMNKRKNIVPNPLAVVKVRNIAEVQNAVKCAVSYSTQVCARGGKHGFENDAGCTNGVLIDMVEIRGISFEHALNTSMFNQLATPVVVFGSGYWLGLLYYELNTQGSLLGHNVVLSGGPINSVGVAGLTLGCGRGLLTQIYGLACDGLKQIEYVDHQGDLRIASATENDDMLWMAKGSAGSFPGIVTKFWMQSYPSPITTLFKKSFGQSDAKAVIKDWIRRGEELTKKKRKMFTSLQLWNYGGAAVEIAMLCFDCDENEKSWVRNQMNGILAVSSSTSSIEERDGTEYLDHLMYESGFEAGPNVWNPPSREAFTDNQQGWGPKGSHKSSINGGNLGYEWTVSNEFVDTIIDWTWGNNQAEYAYGVMVEWYPLGGDAVTADYDGNIINEATFGAYGARHAKWVFHYKHQWNPVDADSIYTGPKWIATGGSNITHENYMIEHHKNYSKAMEQHLSCTNFINYADNNMPCTHGNNDEWLTAFFSDVQRMKQIKTDRDPNNIFRSHISSGFSATPPTTQSPTPQQYPTTQSPTTQSPTRSPTTQSPTQSPTTQSPTTQSPTTQSPTTQSPTTQSPTTQSPTTQPPTPPSPTTPCAGARPRCNPTVVQYCPGHIPCIADYLECLSDISCYCPCSTTS